MKKATATKQGHETDTWDGCTPDGRPPVVGQEYEIEHARKGRFAGRVLSADESTWCEVEITGGVANAVCDYNIRLEGERVSCRSSLCRMTPIDAPPSTEDRIPPRK